jgi:general secretion pathway protein J
MSTNLTTKDKPHSYLNNKSSLRGFTLIEMLVVMVILALTTSLLTEGLSTTWRSFERLGARDLMNSAARLSGGWFEKSLAGAVLYHPFYPNAFGGSQRLEFVSFNSPDDDTHIPQRLVWSIEPLLIISTAQQSSANQWNLVFQSENGKGREVVQVFSSAPYFEYWDGAQWQNEFVPQNASLPAAVRIIVEQKVWVLAKPDRPALADMPPELAQFGEYEF